MAHNFEGLIAVRRSDPEQAFAKIQESLRHFNEASLPGREDSIGAAEIARYRWMAWLNRIQLQLLTQEWRAAEAGLVQLLEFSRREDPHSLPTSLAMLAYDLLRDGRPREALPHLEESLDLLRHEFDFRVVVQVRKMLVRALTELGRTASADAVRALSRYYWRDALPAER